jgi:ferric enterobactin receptor
MAPAQNECTLTFQFASCDLPMILETVSKNCGLRFSFDTDLAHKVQFASFAAEGENWESVLERALAGNELRLQKLGNKRYAIIRQVKEEQSAANKRSISGRVLDAGTGDPLPGAVVYLVRAGEMVGNGAVCDGEGTFDVQGEGEGLTLVASFIGYRSARRLLEADASHGLLLALQPQALQLESVLVTGKSDQAIRRGENAGMLAMSPRHISAISVLGEQDVFRTLQFLPGVSATEESASGLYVRGSTPDENLVLIDGVPIYNTGHFFGMFHAFNAEALEKVDIARGGFGVARGGAVAGLIDITSRPSPGDSLSGSLTGNLAAAGAHISLPFLKRKASVMVAGRRSFADIVQSPLYRRISGNVFQTGSIFEDENSVPEDDTIGYELNPISNFHDLHAKVVIGQGAKGQLSANFYNGRDVVNYNFNSGDEVPGFARDSNEELVLSNNAGGIRYQRQLSSQWDLDASGYVTAYRGFFLNDQFLAEDGDTIDYEGQQNNVVRTLAARTNLLWRPGDKHLFDLGLQARHTLTSFEIGSFEEAELERLDSISIGAAIISGWLGYAWKGVEKLEVAPGLRVNWYEENAEISFEPRMQANYRLGKNLRLNGNLGVYRQFLNPVQVSNTLKLGTDFLALASEENGIQTTESYQAGLGVSWMRPGIWIDVQGYYRRLFGLERYVRVFDANVNANEIDDLLSDGEGTVMGVDLLVRVHRGPWTGWAGYTLSQVEHLFPELSEGNPFPADHDHRHEIKLVNMVKLKRWEFSLTWVYASGKPYSEPSGVDTLVDGNGDDFLELRFDELNSRRLPSYHRLDANIAYNFPIRGVANGRVGISAFNIYNRNNIRDRNYSVRYPDDANEPLEVVRVDRELLGLSPNVFVQFRF